jgi:hypothetical protein
MFLYVYMHLDPRTAAVRYVGVGPLSRACDFQLRAPEHLVWIAELDALDLEPKVALPSRTRDRKEAHEVECALIAWHRKHGSALFNVTDGGLGRKGGVRSEAEKQRLRAAQQAKWLFDPEFKARRLPDITKARAVRNRSPEHRAKITKHETVTGRPCNKCGGTLRYGKSRNCVNCAKKA